MPLRVFMVTGTPYRDPAETAACEDLAEQGALPRQRGAAALAGHLGHRAAEVQVDVGHAVLRAEDLGRLADVRRVGAVELHRAHRLLLVEDEHLPRGRVALDQATAGDHLADVEARALLAAQPAVGRVGDPRHRREDHGHRDLEVPEAERAAGGRGLVGLLLLGRLLRRLVTGRRRDGALPGDRLEGLERAVAHLHQRPARRHQVDEAGAHRLARGEPGGQRRRRALLERCCRTRRA